MLGLFALASALAVASASKCCVPPQWEGQMTSLIAASSDIEKGAFAQVQDFLAYDAVAHKIGILEYITVGDKTSTFSILLDYNTDSRYVIYEGKCLRTKLGRTVSDFGGCVPDNATVLGVDTKIGYGDNDASLQSYALQYPGITTYISLTADACVPVVENTRGSINGNTFIQNNYYFNITAGITPETVTNMASPPVGCENAPTVEAHYSQTFVGRRSVFGF